MLSLVIDSKGGFRGAPYANPEVDRLLDEATKTTDLKKRGELYKQVQKLVVDDAPWIFVDNAIQNAAGTTKVTGFKLHPSFYLVCDRTSMPPCPGRPGARPAALHPALPPLGRGRGRAIVLATRAASWETTSPPGRSSCPSSCPPSASGTTSSSWSGGSTPAS